MWMIRTDSLRLAKCLERSLTFSGHEEQPAQSDPSRNGVRRCVNALSALPDCLVRFALTQERIRHSEMDIRILRCRFFHLFQARDGAGKIPLLKRLNAFFPGLFKMCVIHQLPIFRRANPAARSCKKAARPQDSKRVLWVTILEESVHGTRLGRQIWIQLENTELLGMFCKRNGGMIFIHPWRTEQ